MKVVLFALSLAVITQVVCGYRNYTLNRLCAASNLKLEFDTITDNRPVVLLETGNLSAAIVRQHWNATNMHMASASCHFPVDARRMAPKGADRGIYASVRQMKLRRNATTGACIDSVSFRHENNVSSSPMCGDFQTNDEYNGDESKFLVDESGILWVDVHINKDMPLDSPDGHLELEIVLTAFEKNCFDASVYPRTIICTLTQCIARELENDGIINCPPKRCTDEIRCEMQAPKSGTSNAFSAISSLLMTMICVMCVYSARNSR